MANLLLTLEAGNEDDNTQLIKEDFSYEQLLVAMALPWYANIVNFLVSGLLPPDLKSKKDRSSFMMPNIIIGMNPSYSSIALIK